MKMMMMKLEWLVIKKIDWSMAMAGDAMLARFTTNKGKTFYPNQFSAI
jgi:hypothetical protein